MGEMSQSRSSAKRQRGDRGSRLGELSAPTKRQCRGDFFPASVGCFRAQVYRLRIVKKVKGAL